MTIDDENDSGMQRAGQEWWDCRAAIVRVCKERGLEMSEERAGAFIAILTHAGYFAVKIDDISDDGTTPKAAAETITRLTAERDAALERVALAYDVISGFAEYERLMDAGNDVRAMVTYADVSKAAAAWLAAQSAAATAVGEG